MLKLRISLSHEYLARLIAANRPYVSTILSRFKKKGWINYQDGKLLINLRQIKGLMISPGNGCAD